MNHVFVRPDLPIATRYFQHPYGGRARHIYVSKDAFMRFWNIDETQCDNIPSNVKWFDDMQPGCEILGYVIQERTKFGNHLLPKQYVIVFIQYNRRVVNINVEMN